ncbi:TIGR03118 family protein [Aquabacterium sp. A7-Y]|uniref:TIGR03118 family protein n=1 Tax=Aquabacterium sp. A7-Y TaxID=1349605 RepID=UPI00223CBF1C|nr:TIGR03118 family protein [Aquabacterium sp. A7-Y]MCW7539981.1 TIGR03118 family protein [Aquabacterium sp. A7-Y]
MQRRDFIGWLASSAPLSAAVLSACGGGSDDNDDTDNPPETPQPNRYAAEWLVADPQAAGAFPPALDEVERIDEFLNAWGIAIRPAGAGGHFWVAAGGYSFQFVGDVRASSDSSLRILFQDALALVKVPGAGVPDGETEVTDTTKFIGFTTGVAFNGAPLDSGQFLVRDQPVEVGGRTELLTGSARFVFATDSGVISGWTERDADTGAIVRQDGPAMPMIDLSASGSQFFGLAVKTGSWDELWAADFGSQPQIRAWDSQWRPLDLAARGAFANPFIEGRTQARPGDYVPFNIQVLRWGGRDCAIVAYAKSQPDPADPTRFLAGEEDAIAADQEGDRPDRGRVAIFDLEGRLLQRIEDDGRLNAPWGLAVAPDSGFGRLSGALLVGNFGGRGRIAAYDDEGRFLDFLRGSDNEPFAVPGLWGLQFGNGASLGDANALYLAAGPGDETQGVFGVLRPA